MRASASPFAICSCCILIALLAIGPDPARRAAAQSSEAWPKQQTIPGFADGTWPPILVADENRMVHALASQALDGEEEETYIIYSRWTLADGWSTPNDILLSPLKGRAEVMDALIDEQGVIHLAFFGGDNTAANIYYAQAEAAQAQRATSWSVTKLAGENAVSPPNAALLWEQQGRLILLYNGNSEGNGVYVTYSSDYGRSWSDAAVVSLSSTADEDLWPYDISMALDGSGTIHAIWNTLNLGGQGRGVFYSRLGSGSNEWSAAIELSRNDPVLDLGTMTPVIAAHGDTIVALYNVYGKIVMRKSTDGGVSWSDAAEVFPRQVGVNGRLSLVVDGSGGVHVFFGQRITGNPDIHGMWHSTLQGDRWLEPEAVVSGPQVVDQRGNRAFDPYAARAVVSQGNTLLVTWRSDPGLRGNGVWYSHRTLDLPEQPVESYPQPTATSAPVATPTPVPVIAADLPPAPQMAVSESSTVAAVSQSSPARLMILGLGPTVLLIAALIVITRFSARKQR